MAASQAKIRFEDLGAPVQKLLRAVNGGYTDDDMTLLEYVSVRDMAKIYQEMSSERQAESIWSELKATLVARRAKAEQKALDIQDRQRALEVEAAAQEVATQKATEEEDEERRRRKEERRRRKEAARAEAAEAEANEAAEAAAAAEAEAEAAAAEAEARREAKQRRREEKARRLAEEQEALRAEQEAAQRKKEKARNQRKEWEDHVASHPLEFSSAAPLQLEQVKLNRELPVKAPPKASAELLNRTFTAQCPNCHAKYSKPPVEWDCPMCLRKFRQRIKTWQPDCDNCALCDKKVGRFSRHHCRNCGRVACSACSDFKAMIPAVGYKDNAVKVCRQCMEQIPK